MLNEFLTRLRFFVAGSRRGEVDEEVRFHLDQQIEANIRAGMSPAEARRQAAIAFGGVERAREQCWEERPGYWLETLAQDVRYALRGFEGPVAIGLPSGHVHGANITLPLGARVHLDINNASDPRLHFLEEAVIETTIYG